MKRGLIYTVISLLIVGCSPSLEEVSSLYKKTTRRYEEMLKRDPEEKALRLQLARFYYTFNEYEKVEKLLDEAKGKKEEVLLAKSYAQRKKYTRALELFERIGEVDEGEYLYLYGQTLENKNLYPAAVKIYHKIGGPFKERSQARIKAIGLKIEEGVPPYIKEILQEEESFIENIEEEEAVALLVDESITVNEDNTAVSFIHVIEKVLKEKGKELAEVEIGYDSTYERVELEFARTITPEGKLIYSGKENIRDVSKYLNYPLYSNAKAFIISMPSVEVGSLIEYKVKIYSSKLINEDDFTYLYRVRERFPIVRAQFLLTVPSSKEVSFKFLNKAYADQIKLTPHIHQKGEEKVYSWRFEEITPIIPEENMPPIPFVNPAILISSFSSWQEIYTWWYGLFDDKRVANDEMKQLVKKITKESEGDLEKIKRIYEFCAKDIRYVAVEYGDSGYEPHSAPNVFMNRCGHCKDQSILLVTLLREAGFEAFPVLIPTRQTYPIDEKFPSVNFNHAIAAIRFKGELIFMDPTSSTTSFSDLPLGDQERQVLLFLDEGHLLAATPLMKENGVVYDTTITIDEREDATIERKVTAEGFYAAGQRYYLKYTHPQKIRDGIESKIIKISPFAKLIDYTTEHVDDFDRAPVLEYTFVTKKILSHADNLRVFSSIGDIELDPGMVGKQERLFPVDFDGIFKKTSQLTIHIPSGFTVKYLPQRDVVETPWFTFKRFCAHRDNTIAHRQEFTIKKHLVPQNNYKEFKEELEKVFYLLKEDIILEKGSEL